MEGDLGGAGVVGAAQADLEGQGHEGNGQLAGVTGEGFEAPLAGEEGLGVGGARGGLHSGSPRPRPGAEQAGVAAQRGVRREEAVRLVAGGGDPRVALALAGAGGQQAGLAPQVVAAGGLVEGGGAVTGDGLLAGLRGKALERPPQERGDGGLEPGGGAEEHPEPVCLLLVFIVLRVHSTLPPWRCPFRTTPLRLGARNPLRFRL